MMTATGAITSSYQTRRPLAESISICDRELLVPGVPSDMKRFAFSVLPGIVALVLSIAGCGDRETEREAVGLTRAAFDARLRFLSSDLLEGRAAGTLGADIAARYITNQLELAGLRPAVGDTSFFQPFDLLATSQQLSLSFRAPGGAALSPDPGTEFVGWTGDTVTAGAASGALVFAGYGIYAPEVSRDDFKNLDVSGKFLLVLPSTPESDSVQLSTGGALSRRARWTDKLEEASRRGAAGVIFVHSPELSGHGWEVVRAVARSTRLTLADGSDAPELSLVAWLSLETVQELLSMAGIDLETLLELAGSPEFQPLGTGVTASANFTNEVRSLRGVNVAGWLPGSDPQLSREYVVFTAHYDQLGVGAAIELDSVYNGAYDNASGAALLLGLAEAFAQLSPAPRRSLLFLALAAGVTGPIGTRAYIRAPVVPISRTAAAINLDGVNLWGPTRDIVVWDAEHSTLERLATAAAIAEGLRASGGAVSGELIQYPSDHERFARAGVPAVRVGHGSDFVGRLPEWGRQRLQEYVELHYLRPSDEYRANLDLRGAVQQGRVAFRLGLQVANGQERPVWKNGSPPVPDVRSASSVGRATEN